MSTSSSSPPDSGISLHVTVTVSPSDVPAFLAAFQPVYDLVTAEPECTFFEVYQSPDEPGVLSSKDADWLLSTQITKEYYKEYFRITEPMFIKPREFKLYKRLGTQFSTVKEGNSRVLG